MSCDYGTSFDPPTEPKPRRDFGLCENCGDPKTHRCQYRFCEPCLRIIGIYPTAADFKRIRQCPDQTEATE